MGRNLTKYCNISSFRTPLSYIPHSIPLEQAGLEEKPSVQKVFKSTRKLSTDKTNVAKKSSVGVKSVSKQSSSGDLNRNVQQRRKSSAASRKQSQDNERQSSVIKTTMTVRLKNMKSEERKESKQEDEILDKVGDVNNSVSRKQINFAPTSCKSRQ